LLIDDPGARPSEETSWRAHMCVKTGRLGANVVVTMGTRF